MRKIAEILNDAAGRRPVFSFEFFPPKSEKGETLLYNTIQSLRDLKPDYVSVTYGAGGSTRSKTLEWVQRIQDDYGILAMAHYTSIGATRAEVDVYLKELWDAGIRNIMALRGDRPKDQPDYAPPADGFRFGSELIEHIRTTGLDFCLGGGFYPEVHAEAGSPLDDFENLKTKARAGAEFLVSQLFFENEVYFDYAKRWQAAGMTAPLVPGLMPITNFSQIERFTEMAGCKIPAALVEDLKVCGEDRDRLLRVSLEYSIRQCRELLAGGAPGIHFYTLNQSHLTTEILKALKDS
ncbi:MAG: methylenetetrahydrofolate reductase [NAD(P)H] [Leptospirales bacterium]